jgi:deoxycytidine triphosphate deaminase
MCDAYTVHRYGPAGVAAMSEFLDVASDEASDRQRQLKYPPEWLRLSLMADWAASYMPSDSELRSLLNPLIETWRGYPSSATGGSIGDALEKHLSLKGRDIWQATLMWAGAPYVAESRRQQIARSIKDLDNGIPPERYPGAGSDAIGIVEAVDVINAGWAERAANSPWPIDKLVTKSLDGLDFLRRWPESESLRELPRKELTDTVSGTLSREAIVAYLNRDSNRLVVTPFLPKSLRAAGLDVRLGTQFIVFRRSNIASVSMLADVDLAFDLQRFEEHSWGDAFVLHPDELVLASTLEYFVFPNDIAGQVITRSSYGRLGVITATAIQVHPFYRGVLTLELVNLGRVPLLLTPGERLAQVVFQRVQPASIHPDESTYKCPTGPEITRLRIDEVEQRALQKGRDPVSNIGSGSDAPT